VSITNAATGHTATEIIRTIDEGHRERSAGIGIALLALNIGLYASTLLGILAASNPLLKAFLILFNGLFIGTLFVLAHDACHGSLTPHAFLNGLIARVAFLPALQPYSTWVLGHNRLHHSMTNLRGRDYVWTPLTWQEYRRMGWFGRAVERFYRSLAGLGLYYMVEMWFKHMIFPRRSDLAQIKNRRLLWSDLALVAIYAVCMCTSVLAANRLIAGALDRPAISPAWPLTTALLLPYLVWSYLSGFLTYLHHTHPRTVWFADRREWNFYRGQLRDTVHVKFPRLVGLFFHNIMEHTAHHVDPKIPLYHLAGGQRQLEARFDEIIEEEWSLRGFLKTLSACQLYDYANHQWLGFDGRPTTEAATFADSVFEAETAADRRLFPTRTIVRESEPSESLLTGGL
jgi:acyl-lipid omega-6 desaturase (Delta-12 desaturase)